VAALLDAGFRLQHQQVAAVDVISGARQVGPDLLVGFDGEYFSTSRWSPAAGQ
jgi:hypothetical protein